MKRTAQLLALLATALTVAACGGADDSTGGGSAGSGSGSQGTLNLVAYSTPEVVYDEIIPDFPKTPAGEGVEFKTSDGASGEQSRAVEAGLPADEVRELLAGDRFADAVRADEEAAAQLGIRGVPFFVLGRRFGVSGAQPAYVMLQALRKVWDEVAAKAA